MNRFEIAAALQVTPAAVCRMARREYARIARLASRSVSDARIWGQVQANLEVDAQAAPIRRAANRRANIAIAQAHAEFDAADRANPWSVVCAA